MQLLNIFTSPKIFALDCTDVFSLINMLPVELISESLPIKTLSSMSKEQSFLT